jgi:hypothetical protein
MTDLPALRPLHSTPRPLQMKQAPAAFVPPAANWQDSQEQLGRSQNSGRCGTHWPRGFARPGQQHYGRDAPHVAQGKTTEIAVSPASFRWRETARPH